MHERSDEQRVRDGGDTEPPAEQHPRRHHHDLDGGPHDGDRPARARDEAGHEPVTRAGAESAADVERGGEAVEGDARGGDEHAPARGEVTDTAEQCEERVDEHADDEHVGDRPEPGALPQRDPAREHERADRDRDRAEARPRTARDALAEHVPRHVAQPGVDEHRDGQRVQHEAERETHEATTGGGGDHRPILADGTDVLRGSSRVVPSAQSRRAAAAPARRPREPSARTTRPNAATNATRTPVTTTTISMGTNLAGHGY